MCCTTTRDCCDVQTVRAGRWSSDELGCCVAVPRHFRSVKEKQEMLESYRDQLKKELEGVDERIGELEKK